MPIALQSLVGRCPASLSIVALILYLFVCCETVPWISITTFSGDASFGVKVWIYEVATSPLFCFPSSTAQGFDTNGLSTPETVEQYPPSISNSLVHRLPYAPPTGITLDAGSFTDSVRHRTAAIPFNRVAISACMNGA